MTTLCPKPSFLPKPSKKSNLPDHIQSGEWRLSSSNSLPAVRKIYESNEALNRALSVADSLGLKPLSYSLRRLTDPRARNVPKQLPRIVSLADFEKTCVIWEHCGIDLRVSKCLSRIRGLRRVKRVAYIVKEVINALLYMLKHKIHHGDLKTENVMIDTCDGNNPRICVIDFDKCGEEEMGTPFSYPPEKELSEARDVWAIGLLSFELLTGTMTSISKFCTEESSKTYERPIKSFSNKCFVGKETFLVEDDVFKLQSVLGLQCSKAAIVFISSCLTSDPERRPSFEKLLEFEWIECSNWV